MWWLAKNEKSKSVWLWNQLQRDPSNPIWCSNPPFWANWQSVLTCLLCLRVTRSSELTLIATHWGWQIRSDRYRMLTVRARISSNEQLVTNLSKITITLGIFQMAVLMRIRGSILPILPRDWGLTCQRLLILSFSLSFFFRDRNEVEFGYMFPCHFFSFCSAWRGFQLLVIEAEYESMPNFWTKSRSETAR